MFDSLSSLEDLNLGFCQLQSLPVGIFDKLRNLKSLDIGENPLKEIHPEHFDHLTKLENLELRKTQLLPDNIERIRAVFRLASQK